MRRFSVILVLAVSGLSQTARGRQSDTAAWRDPATGLTWAAADNGIGVSAGQAARYCGALTLGGHQDWRLPGIEELQGIFGGPPDGNGRRLAGPVKATGWAWSSTPGQQPGEQWVLDFGDGGRASAVTGDSGLNRALCVRGHSRRKAPNQR
jgi:hypothetical protein